MVERDESGGDGTVVCVQKFSLSLSGRRRRRRLVTLSPETQTVDDGNVEIVFRDDDAVDPKAEYIVGKRRWGAAMRRRSRIQKKKEEDRTAKPSSSSPFL